MTSSSPDLSRPFSEATKGLVGWVPTSAETDQISDSMSKVTGLMESSALFDAASRMLESLTLSMAAVDLSAHLDEMSQIAELMTPVTRLVESSALFDAASRMAESLTLSVAAVDFGEGLEGTSQVMESLSQVATSQVMESLTLPGNVLNLSPHLAAMSHIVDAIAPIASLVDTDRVVDAARWLSSSLDPSLDLAQLTATMGAFDRVLELSQRATNDVEGRDALIALASRADLEAYIDDALETERSFGEIVDNLATVEPSGGGDSFDIVRVGVRDGSGRIFASVRAGAALLVGALCWLCDAAMNGDTSPVAAIALAIAVYRGMAHC